MNLELEWKSSFLPRGKRVWGPKGKDRRHALERPVVWREAAATFIPVQTVYQGYSPRGAAALEGSPMLQFS